MTSSSSLAGLLNSGVIDNSMSQLLPQSLIVLLSGNKAFELVGFRAGLGSLVVYLSSSC